MWKKYQEGNPTTGYGPSFAQAQQISARRQLDAAQQMSMELDKSELHTAIPNNRDETVALSCKHRPFTEKVQKSNEKKSYQCIWSNYPAQRK